MTETLLYLEVDRVIVQLHTLHSFVRYTHNVNKKTSNLMKVSARAINF